MSANAFIVGNIVHDMEVKAAGNTSVLNVSVAVNFKKNRDAEEEVTYIECTLWGSLAENFGNSLHKGDRVFVGGRLKQENWEGKNGEKRSKLVLIANEAGPDFRFANGRVSKNPRPGGQDQNRSASQTAPASSRNYNFDDESF